MKTTNIFINIYDDRVEVISPGSIPQGLKLKQVKGKSIPRNNLIHSLFKKIGYVEKSGSGLEKMEKLMLEHGLQKPEYETSKVFFQVTFNGPQDKILELVKDKKVVDLRELGLNARQISALAMMVNEKQVMTNEKYVQLFKVSRATVKRDLQKLVKENLIIKKGAGRGRYYIAS